MVFLPELDAARPELRKGTLGETLTLYPKQNGNLISNLSSATYTIRDPNGVVLVDAATATVSTTTYGARTIGVISVAMPGISYLGMNFILEVAWVKIDQTRGTEVLTFDVVRVPLGALLSMNDLIEGYAEVQEILLSIADRMGLSSTDQANMESITGVYANRARAAFQSMLELRADQEGKPRPAMILDRRKIIPIEAHLALRDIFAAIARAPLDDPEDRDAGRYRFHAAEAGRLFDALRIPVDLDEDGTADATLNNYNQVFRTARGQAR